MKRALWLCAALGCSAPCPPATPETFATDYQAFYVCLEASTPCGPDGYAEGFGGRYVRAYVEDILPDLTPDGAAWLTRVGVCLQERLAEAIDRDPTCDELWVSGFGTHADCYVETGYCDLDVGDQLAVLGTITEADRSLTEVSDAIADVVRRCTDR